jgi:hypothetical protein
MQIDAMERNRGNQRCLLLDSSEQIIGLYGTQKTQRLLFGLFAVTTLGWTSLCSALWASELPKQGAKTNDSRRDMIAVLDAASPHPSLGEQARVFDQFIGTWECDYANFAENGTITRGKGEAMFGWILDGHAVQDVWTWTAEGDGGQRELVTDIRFFDSKSGKWRAVWVDPTSSLVKTASGGVVGDRIVLESAATDGSLDRWSFNDIAKDSFVWRGEKSRDGGKTWRLWAEHHLKRESGTAPGKNKS